MFSRDWRLQNLPWTLIMTVIALLLLGLSALDRGDEIVGVGETASRQMLWILISLPVILLTLLIPYQTLCRLALPLFLFTVAVLVFVLFMPARHGSRRWIPLGLLDLQPSEFAKLTTIFALAAILSSRNSFRTIPGLILPTLIAFVPMGLILKEPDLGTAMVFLPVWFLMLFTAGARPRHLLAATLLGLCTLPVLWMGMSAEQKSRVVSVFTQRDAGPTPRGDGYHLHQSKRMLVLGGVWGGSVEELAAYDPAMSHLPAGRTDFIFCLLGQRFGLAGCLLTLMLFALLVWEGMLIGLRSREPFGRLVAVGITTLLATQFAINSAMTIGLMPITGLTLPLMSYGGSSLLSTAVGLALLVNIALRPRNELGPTPFAFSNRPRGIRARDSIIV